MSKGSWDFKEQLKVGDRGEELFLENYPKKLTIYPGKEYDFTCESGAKIELKTDTYNINKTENFFLERFSDLERETPGGPWRAANDGIDIFCYMFVRHNIWFQFEDVPALVQRVDEILEGRKGGLVYIKNRGWVTAGHKIKRVDLEDLYDIWEF